MYPEVSKQLKKNCKRSSEHKIPVFCTEMDGYTNTHTQTHRQMQRQADTYENIRLQGYYICQIFSVASPGYIKVCIFMAAAGLHLYMFVTCG